ncbi:hypothetical protein LJC58_05435 [Lachnospiraceae bacterium OttesenSCG-928-D06]|nr:hypothetical protein [Lachnospiraceae bacterium OttesenSCG-928-D06]
MKIVKLSRIFMYGMAFLISFFLVIISFCYVIDIKNMAIKNDSILYCLLAVMGFLLLMELYFKFTSINLSLFNKILLGIVLCYSILICLFWIYNSKSLPAGDQKSIYDMAMRAVNHDLLAVAPTGSYLSLWPFQSGLLFVYEAILRLIPSANHTTIQLTNVVFIPLLIISGYHLLKKWIHHEKAITYFLVLIAFCFPYYLYSNFMYGEIPSVGLIFFSSWMLTEYKSSGKIRYAFLASGSVFLAMLYRTNTLIFVVACMIAFIITFLQERRLREFIIIVLLLLATVTASNFPRFFYEHRANNTMGAGVPAISYLAMGMQPEGGAAPGWWNGYHSNLYMELDYNAELTSEYSIQSIKESLHYFATHPTEAIAFYNKKLITQWCDQNYSCFNSTESLFEDRRDIAWNIYSGKLNIVLLEIMNYHQTITYLGLFLFCSIPVITWLGKRKSGILIFRNDINDFENYLLMICVIGGFLFSIIWEGNSRYVFPYTVMMLPYTAIGYDKLMSVIHSIFTHLLSHSHIEHQHDSDHANLKAK